MRNWHWLKPNSTTKIPEHHVCVATVCRPANKDPAALELAAWALTSATFTNGKWTMHEHASSTHGQTFWVELLKHLPAKRKTWVWLLCPRLDLPALMFAREIQAGLFTRRYWVFGDPPVIIDGHYYRRAVRFVGLANWLPGDTFQIDALANGEACLHAYNTGSGGTSAYCALHLADATAKVVGKILRTVHREDLGHLRSTVGGQSLQSYRHLHLPGKILCHGHAESLRLERECAIGWPPDMRRLGAVNETIYVCDVNALYPHVMATYPMPRKWLWYTQGASTDDLKKAAQSALLIARVKVSDWGRSYLITDHGKCRTVRGAFNGTLCGPDLDSALSRGCIQHVWEAVGYEGVGMFCGWADWVYAMRQRYKRESDQVGAHVAKMLSVALWGQFAARLQRYVSTDEVKAPQPYGEFFWHPAGCAGHVKCRAVAGLVDKMESRAEPDDSIPSISAFVATYARTYMAGLRAFAGEGNVVYQVADSLHVTQAGYDALQKNGLIDPDKRGMLKLARTVHKSHYLAPNTIVQDDDLTAAGIYGRATEVRPGVFRWRLPRRFQETMTQAPTGTIAAPEVTRSVADCPGTAQLGCR